MNRKTVRTDSANSASFPAPRVDRLDRGADRPENPPASDAFAAAMIEDLDPKGPAEALIAGRIALAAWRLSRRSGQGPLRSVEDREEIALYRGLQALSRLRASREPRWGRPGSRAETPEIQDETGPSEFGPIAPADPVRDSIAEGDADASGFGHLWRGRLVLDPKVSERSPVIQGTFITVGRIVSLVVDGSSWGDILRDHPELTEADIRACLAYSIEEEGSGLPY